MRPAKKSAEATPWLDELSQALEPDWHGRHAAGRVERHVEILGEVAHQLSSAPDRADRPSNAAEAETRAWDYLGDLQRRTPRTGLSAPSATFVDHIVGMFGRYGEHLFVCFDDSRIPATTNGLEGFFGLGKRVVRKALGAGSTTNSVVTNLGAEVLMALHQVRARDNNTVFPPPIDLHAYQTARAELDQHERPARLRRSWLRDQGTYLVSLLDRWLSSP